MSKRKNTHPRNERKGRKRNSGDQHGAVTVPATARTPLLYGKHAVLAALANPARRIRQLMLTAEAQNNMQADLTTALQNGGHENIALVSVDKRTLEDRLPPGAVHQGVALDAEPPQARQIEDILDETQNDPTATLVILDQATDPHNIGAILRSAAAFGAAAVVVQDRHAPDITGTMAKAASGALERVALVRTTNLVRAMEKAKAAEYWCIGLDGQAPQTIAEADLSGRVALVLGAEGGGLRRLTRENCDLLVKVPMSDAVESLNLSNAAAVALYERARG